MKIRIGMGQMLVEGGKPGENLRRADEMILQAAARACDVVVLPECLDFGWTHPSAREGAQPIPGEHSGRLAAAAREAGIAVVAGLAERSQSRLYNTAVVLSADGEMLLKHRKINELSIAHDLYSTGDSLGVAHTRFGDIAAPVCADNFPEWLVLAHSLARMGAQLFLSPSAWAVDAGHDNARDPYGALWLESYTEIAGLYDAYVIGVSNVGWLTAGPWAGRKCIGCSLAVGPGGDVLAQGPYGADAEALIPVEVDLRPPVARGADFAEVLARRGYHGP